ncbi:uncharacterized protein LOC129741200 [Uranotaenia lowii]|uniref:uncharacterized protein LOC129741200 n=1 Tax=Uranotaenia lowii TaxID=190385 RepID=UPI00247A7A69|nr:uncharacterized protein LOC129741200 [Uranotaenia lowii]
MRDSLFASFAGGSKFPKIDLFQAYLQKEVASGIEKFSEHAPHRPNRLVYGISSAPAIWQLQIEATLQGVEGVSIFLDDIKVTATISYHNIQVNREKCKFFTNCIQYCGYLIVYIEYLLYSLLNLLKKEVDLKWTKECEKSFRIVKERMQADNCLVHYGTNGSERPIQFASQTLNRTQQAYKQVNKKAYAIVFGVKKFSQYINGRNCTLLKDNQSVSKIFNANKERSSHIFRAYNATLRPLSTIVQLSLKRNGIVHKMGSPYHPDTNGQAERYVQSVKLMVMVTESVYEISCLTISGSSEEFF